ncbi:uncharacterized protein At1g66480-like [Prosopis cineraria]|uniref:uncharacterized protein At1g66480-like n=1 Tax=Prosopis cineraria TaxID=364024 RepID=UPI0024106437|nr:uncharacterized protein At1g66480-like [Prosopis cineraria]
MGNAVGRSRKAKVMKVDGETFKLKTPARVDDVVKDHPGHVLLDSEAVKHFGVRAKPLEPHQELKPKRIYFLVELPKAQPPAEPQLARRVRSSGIRGMNAKDRLDFLMLSKRSVSDITFANKQLPPVGQLDGSGADGEPIRVKMRLPKAQLEKLMEESDDRAQVAEKIIKLYMANNAAEAGGVAVEAKPELGAKKEARKPRGKRVSFSPMEGEIRVEAASQ